jgi:hypothetical protein
MANITWQKFEKIAEAYFRKNGFPNITGIKKECTVPVGEKCKGEHRFDLKNDDKNGKVLVECKAHTWTKGNNAPSAKISVWNEAMYYFRLAPRGYQKYFFALKSVNKNGKTLLEYYLKHYCFFIPEDVQLCEYDPKSGKCKEYTNPQKRDG